MKNNTVFSDSSIFSQLPGLFLIKDARSNYIDITQECARLLGWKKVKNCIGKNDYELPCQAVESAEQFIAVDQKVVATEKKLYL